MAKCTNEKDCLVVNYICQTCGVVFSADEFFKTRLLIAKQSLKIQKRRRLTQAKRNRIFLRDQFTCQCCKVDLRKLPKSDRVIDHIVPLVLGGSNDDSNLQALCSECDSLKGARIINYKNSDELRNKP